MYDVVHFSAECYPIAKVGGLGDVVGALPKYLNQAGVSSCVVMPRYNLKWNQTHQSEWVFSGVCQNENFKVEFYVVKPVEQQLGFDIYFIDIPYLIYREGVYGYEDDHLRFLFFQQACLHWVQTWTNKPKVLHCHDHHTGLIPFMVNQCYDFDALKGTKTIFTIHNGLYSGSFHANQVSFFPHFPRESYGLLEWEQMICPLAAGIKCANQVTTVSAGYLEELKHSPNPFNWLYNEYWFKSTGILNGIDTEVWNPKTDTYLNHHLSNDFGRFKYENKKEVCNTYNLNPELPLTVFIGRLNHEKGGELIASAIGEFLAYNKGMNFLVLGSGANYIEDQIRHITSVCYKQVANYIGYNEALSHQLYAAADFLLMPSLVEPCGLNQLYSLRYGTIPIVRSTGGLKDSVMDFGDQGGYGIRFNQAETGDIVSSFYRALELFYQTQKMNEVREIATSLDFSWNNAVQKYIAVYNK